MSETVARGADERWADLYGECRPILFRAAALMVGESDAEELVQDGFERAMRQRRFFEQTREPCAWLRTVVVRLAISRLRRRALWQRLRPTSIEIAEPDPALLDLRRAILRLPPKQRAAVVMHYFYDADYDEIARALALNASSVGKLLTRSRRAMGQELEPDND